MRANDAGENILTPTIGVSYHTLFVHARVFPSSARLLRALFGLPLPLFKAANVDVSESQFGQRSRRFVSVLFRQFPSIWSATRGTIPVFGFNFDQPQKQHLLPNFSLKYLLTMEETNPIELSPVA